MEFKECIINNSTYKNKTFISPTEKNNKGNFVFDLKDKNCNEFFQKIRKKLIQAKNQYQQNCHLFQMSLDINNIIN